MLPHTVIEHPIPPTWNNESEILILGSFPSVKSRETGYFYGHPQNRFWRVLSAIYEDVCPATKKEKEAFLFRHHIAVWDVISSCEITGSADSSIQNVTANDVNILLDGAQIERIFCNGQTAYKLYNRYLFPVTNRSATCLPSTSPANAFWTVDRLIKAWIQIKQPV